MKDIIRKGLLASIGLASYTKDYLKDLTEELRKQGFTEAEGKKIVDQLLAEGKKTKDQIIEMTEEKIDAIMKAVNTGSKNSEKPKQSKASPKKSSKKTFKKSPKKKKKSGK